MNFDSFTTPAAACAHQVNLLRELVREAGRQTIDAGRVCNAFLACDGDLQKARAQLGLGGGSIAATPAAAQASGGGGWDKIVGALNARRGSFRDDVARG